MGTKSEECKPFRQREAPSNTIRSSSVIVEYKASTNDNTLHLLSSLDCNTPCLKTAISSITKEFIIPLTSLQLKVGLLGTRQIIKYPVFVVRCHDTNVTAWRRYVIFAYYLISSRPARSGGNGVGPRLSKLILLLVLLSTRIR